MLVTLNTCIAIYGHSRRIYQNPEYCTGRVHGGDVLGLAGNRHYTIGTAGAIHISHKHCIRLRSYRQVIRSVADWSITKLTRLNCQNGTLMILFYIILLVCIFTLARQPRLLGQETGCPLFHGGHGP